MENNYNNKWKGISLLCLLGTAISIGMGFYKMLVYSEGEVLFNPYRYIEPVNYYVGADAYNLIINAGYATAYFTLAAVFMIASVGCLIAYFLYDIRFETQRKQIVEPEGQVIIQQREKQQTRQEQSQPVSKNTIYRKRNDIPHSVQDTIKILDKKQGEYVIGNSLETFEE